MDSNYKPVDMTGCLADPQIKLSKALENRDLIEFRAALSIGANALVRDEKNMSIFDKALRTPGCSEFIKECLLIGCDPNYINTCFNKAAINFATDSRDPENLKELLKSPGVNVNHTYSSLTPLNSLASNLNNENATKVIECIKLLLSYGASPNIPDHREMTPLQIIIRNHKINDMQKYELVHMFLSLEDIDIDTFRNGELRGILETKYPLMELPAKREQNLATFRSFLTDIRNGNMELFEQNYNNSRLTTPDEEVELLVTAIENGAHRAFDIILANGVDYNKLIRDSKIAAIQIAWIYGNWYALERLLQQPDIKLYKNDALCNIVCKLNEQSSFDYCNYWKCFYVLLESDKIDINATDFCKCTALHYAVKYHNNKAVKELLKRGACITLENDFKELPLNGMSPSVWEDHLDECISSNDENFGDKNYQLIISFQNFMTTQQKKKKQLREVLSPIAYMAETKEYRYLLQHPVITSILFLKWHKLSLGFYINFLAYLLFAVSIVAHIILEARNIQEENLKLITRYCSYLGISYLIAREFLQVIMSPWKYIKSITNYLEILLIILSILTFQDLKNEDLQSNIGVACILLLAYELFLLVGSLPISSISTHMLMLEAVCKSFVKSFLFYSIFVFTFTLCFYIKIGNEPVENSEDKFHSFSEPLLAFSKTIVMFTGEFDAGSLKLDTDYTRLLFLSFVFFMTIILFNLLNGLAVSDTQAIKDQAEINDIICRSQLLSRYEKAVFKQSDNFARILKYQPFRLITQIFSKLFPDYTTDVQISILPNDKNKVLSSKTNNTTQLSSVKVENLKEETENTVTLSRSVLNVDEESNKKDCLSFNKLLNWFSSKFIEKLLRIDERTVNQAMLILEKKSTLSIENRLDAMEGKLNDIIKYLKVPNTEDAECI